MIPIYPISTQSQSYPTMRLHCLNQRIVKHPKQLQKYARYQAKEMKAARRYHQDQRGERKSSEISRMRLVYRLVLMFLDRANYGSRGKQKDVPDEAALDEMMVRMVTRMRDAAEKDSEANKKREPAVAKLRLLPKVQEQLQKTQFADQFLDNHLLEGIKTWLEPLPDGSLPSLDIQKVLVKALSALPIQTLHLRESGLVSVHVDIVGKSSYVLQ
jgi:hypothetical protein